MSARTPKSQEIIASEEDRYVYLEAFRDALDAQAIFENTSNEYKETLARRMERACYNKVIIACTKEFIPCVWSEARFVHRYSTECYRVLANLGNNLFIFSDYLSSKLASGEIKPTEVAELTSEELDPEASREEREAIEIRKRQKVEKKYTERYTCPRCKSKKAEYSESGATRSLDEISTFAMRCLVCDHTWQKG